MKLLTMKLLKLMVISLLVAGLSWSALAAVRSGGNLASFTCLSSDTKPPAHNGDTCYETDTGLMFIYNGSWTLAYDGVTAGPDTLTAPSTGTTPVNVEGFDEITCTATVSGISDSIIVALLGKVAEGGWTNLESDSTTVTANDNYLWTYTKCATLDSIKLYFSSEFGGTNAQIISYSKRTRRQ